MGRLRFFTALFVLTFALTSHASSHREAPGTSQDPTADNTDVYVFRSPDAPNTVTIIANFIPFEEPAGGPNFHAFSDNVIYELHIDNNGDAREDITYQFRFQTDVRNGNTFLYNVGPVTSLDDADLNVRQFYTVTRIAGNRRTGSAASLAASPGARFQVAPANVGPRSTPNYEALAAAAIFNMGTDGAKVFAGPRDDPFFVDLGSIFDLATLRPVQQLHVVQPTPASTAAAGVDTLRGYNVHTIAIQVPIASLTSNGQAPSDPAAANAIIGVWSTTSRPRSLVVSGGRSRAVGGAQQVSRLGMPLVNEVVLPLAFKDIFNSSEPSGDFPLFQANETFRNRVLDPEVARLLPVLYPTVFTTASSVPAAPRNDLVTIFLTGIDGVNKPANVVPADMIRLNVAIPVTASASVSRMGVLGGDAGGFPNGRRLGDDVVDIALQAVAGATPLTPAFNKAPNNTLGDGVNTNDRSYLATFPYVASPHQGYDHGHHAGGTP